MRRYARTFLLVALMLLFSGATHATCGATNYDGTAGKLYDMTKFILVCCVYCLWITEAIASILSVYGATQVYIKMQTGEDGIMKNIMMLVGAVLFLISATIVMPAFFGFTYGGVMPTFGTNPDSMPDRIW